MDQNQSRYFGEFGGRFIAEPLMAAVEDLSVAWREAWADPQFRGDFEKLLREYANRPSS